MKVTVVGVLEADLKGLVKRLGKLDISIETILTKALRRSTRILKRVVEAKKDLLSL